MYVPFMFTLSVFTFSILAALAHEFIKHKCRIILAARSIDKLKRIKDEMVEMYKVRICIFDRIVTALPYTRMYTCARITWQLLGCIYIHYPMWVFCVSCALSWYGLTYVVFFFICICKEFIGWGKAVYSISPPLKARIQISHQCIVQPVCI